jgi:FtsZ-interacting cell division protein ZipA
LLLLALLTAVAAIAAVWVVDETWALRVGVTGIVLVVLAALWTSIRASRSLREQAWQESIARSRELAETRRELADLKAMHVELLLELRVMREEAAQLAQDAARSAEDDADQRALMRQLLQPRQAVHDPLYPSLHLPLVRAAFSTELPTSPVATPRPAPPGLQRESTTGREAQPPRQLLDLTASEIARLRPAN